MDRSILDQSFKPSPRIMDFDIKLVALTILKETAKLNVLYRLLNV